MPRMNTGLCQSTLVTGRLAAAQESPEQAIVRLFGGSHEESPGAGVAGRSPWNEHQFADLCQFSGVAAGSGTAGGAGAGCRLSRN